MYRCMWYVQYITEKNSRLDFALISLDNWFRSDFSKEEKDENVKTASEGIIAATPECYCQKQKKKKEREYRKSLLSSSSI